MKVVLHPGESVDVEFFESDGSIIVAFNESDISVSTDWPDTEGRKGVIYQEKFLTMDDMFGKAS